MLKILTNKHIQAYLAAASLSVLVVGVLITIFRAEARSARIRGELTRIAFVLGNYSARHGRFPSPFITSDDGGALHSWRTAIVVDDPEMAGDLRGTYSFDVPWNNEDNRDVTMDENLLWCSRDIARSQRNWTSFVGIVSEETAENRSVLQAVIAMRNSGIQWAEPSDISASDFATMIAQRDPRIADAWGIRMDGAMFRVTYEDGLPALLFVPTADLSVEKMVKMLLSP